MLLHYLGKADQAKYVLKKKQKTWKKHPDIINRNLKKNQQILINFSGNISDTTGYQISVLVSTSPNVCFALPRERKPSIIRAKMDFKKRQ